MVFSRQAILPLDVLLGLKVEHHDVLTPRDYQGEVGLSLTDVFEHVIDHLKLSKLKMQKQYNIGIRFNEESRGEGVVKGQVLQNRRK